MHHGTEGVQMKIKVTRLKNLLFVLPRAEIIAASLVQASTGMVFWKTWSDTTPKSSAHISWIFSIFLFCKREKKKEFDYSKKKHHHTIQLPLKNMRNAIETTTPLLSLLLPHSFIHGKSKMEQHSSHEHTYKLRCD